MTGNKPFVIPREENGIIPAGLIDSMADQEWVQRGTVVYFLTIQMCIKFLGCDAQGYQNERYIS